MQDLTRFSAAGGCSCKLPGDQLREILKGVTILDNTSFDVAADDAAFLELEHGQVLVSSVDYQNPIVEDPFLAGQIGALNALSDVFACGVQPRWAEVILAVPQIDRSAQIESGRQMMRGIHKACADVGCEIVGGHTIVLPTPLVGLAVRGIAPADHIKRKSGAKPGDLLLLTKPIGNGIAVAARQVGFLTDENWRVALKEMCRSNAIGRMFGQLPAVSSLTDITGFGIAGHSLEVARSSGVTLYLDLEKIPALPGIKRAAQNGFVPRLAGSNWEVAATEIGGAEQLADAEKLFLADPQTNGGLMATVCSDLAAQVIDLASKQGVEVVVIGEVSEQGPHKCIVRKA